MIWATLAASVDLATWLLVPAPIRATAESNVLAAGPFEAAALKVLALAVTGALLSRIRTRSSRPAIALFVAICLAGALSNLRGLGA